MARKHSAMWVYIWCILACVFFMSTIVIPKSTACDRLVHGQSHSALNQLDVRNGQTEYRANKIAYLENLFPQAEFDHLHQAVMNETQSASVQRTCGLLSGFRKAGALSSASIKSQEIKELYYNPYLLQVIRSVTGNPRMQTVSCGDKSSYNVLLYNKPNDHIEWHTDPNHYRGDRVTVLICMANSNSSNTDVSAAELLYDINGTVNSIQMKPNSILIFNGSRIRHKATGIQENELRTLISFTYCDICEQTLWGWFVRSIKERVLNY